MDVKYNGNNNRIRLSPEEIERRRLINLSRKPAKNSKKRNKSSKFLFYVMMVLLFIFTITALSCTVLFPVNKYRVTGNKTLSAADIVAACSIGKGQNIVVADGKGAASGIKNKLPIVASAKITKNLNGTVNIAVVESKIVAAFFDNNKYFSVDQFGKILAISANTPTVPIICGTPLSNPKIKEKFVVKNASNADEINNIFNHIIAINDGKEIAFDLTNTYKMQLVYGAKYIVNLGDSTNIDYKISFLEQVTAKLDKTEGQGVIDLSYLSDTNDRVYFKRMDTTSLIQTFLAKCGIKTDLVSKPKTGTSSTANNSSSAKTSSTTSSKTVNIFSQTLTSSDNSSSKSTSSQVKP